MPGVLLVRTLLVYVEFSFLPYDVNVELGDKNGYTVQYGTLRYLVQYPSIASITASRTVQSRFYEHTKLTNLVRRRQDSERAYWSRSVPVR